MRNHLVTGATGFLGAAAVIELLQRTDDRVSCVVRGADPEGRLAESLVRAAEVYGCRDVLRDVRDRVHAVHGDMSHASELEPALADEGITHVWHVAASLKFRARDAEEIVRTNVTGTAELVDMAARLGAHTFVYFSTAFVAGTHPGAFSEHSEFVGAASNEYESSKRAAEERVLDARPGGLRPVIVRPSIVMGHSETRAALSDMGVYGFAESLYRLRRLAPEHIRDVFATRPMRIVGDPEVEINLVPVDAVVRSAVRLGLDEEAHGVFHLTNRRGTSVRTCFEAVCQLLDVPMPEFVDTADRLELVDQMIAKRTEFHAPYLRRSRIFARTWSDGRAGTSDLDVVYGVQEISDLLEWYLANEVGPAPTVLDR